MRNDRNATTEGKGCGLVFGESFFFILFSVKLLYKRKENILSFYPFSRNVLHRCGDVGYLFGNRLFINVDAYSDGDGFYSAVFGNCLGEYATELFLFSIPPCVQVVYPFYLAVNIRRFVQSAAKSNSAFRGYLLKVYLI